MRGSGTFTRTKDDMWCYRISVDSADGTSRPRFYGATQRDCRDQADAYRTRLRAGMRPNDGELLSDYLPHWLAGRRYELRERTHESYDGHIRTHLVPMLGHLEVAALTRRHVVNLMSKLSAQGLSARTVNSYKQTLGSAMQDALRDGLVTQNVVRLVKAMPQERAEIEPLVAGDIEQLRDAVRGTREEALYTVELSFGLRQGELLGLTWADVDTDRGIIRIAHALHDKGRGGFEVTELKTKHSRRTLVMPQFVASSLERQRGQQDRELAGKWQHPDWPAGLVFRDTNGRPLAGDAVTKRFQRLLRDLGIPRRRFHDLRHTCATFLLMSGVEMKVIQQILGHSTIAVTSDIYAHVLPQMQEAALAHMGSLLTAQSSAQQPAESHDASARTVKAGT